VIVLGTGKEFKILVDRLCGEAYKPIALVIKEVNWL
jgi:hypothetical protein